MADKTLRINITTDVTELEKLKKAVKEVEADLSKVANRATGIAKEVKLVDWTAFGGRNQIKDAEDALIRYEKRIAGLQSKLVQGLSASTSFDSMKLTGGMSTAGVMASKAATDQLTQSLGKNADALRANGAAAQETERHTRNLFIRVGEAIGSYRIWNALLNTIFHGPSTITQVGIELEATQSILQSTMGSAAGAAGAMQFLDKEAARTGITISTLRTSWRDFSASTTMAGMTLSSTANMFTNLNTVITALHLTSDRAQGVFNAMAQIFNKSKVQSEELVKQLGNLLPGAFASFAASVHDANGKIGISTQELSTRMKKGTVLAKDTMEDFAQFMSDKFVASFALASTGMNATVGRMQTSFTHLGEAFYGLSSGPIVSVVKGVTNIADAMSKAISATENYSNSLIVLKSVIEGGVIVAIGSLLANVTKLKIAFSLLTLPNLLLTGLAAAASYIAYIYNKVQAPLDKLKEAQAQIQEARSQKLFEDKTATITMRVENAEPIRKAMKELADLKAAYDDFRRQSSPDRSSSVEEYNAFQKTSGDFVQALEDKAKLIEDAKIAERAKMEAFDKEQADRSNALQQSSAGNSLNLLKTQLKDTKLLLNERLDIIDSMAKSEELITKDSISKIEDVHKNHLTTEYEYTKNLNEAMQSGLQRQITLTKEKIDLVEKAKAALTPVAKTTIADIDNDVLNTDQYKEAVAVLAAYSKGLEENTTKVKDNKVAFDLTIDGQKVNIDFATDQLAKLKEQVAAYENQTVAMKDQTSATGELNDSTKRAMELDTKLRSLKEQLATQSQEASKQARESATELSGIARKELDTQIEKYKELTLSTRDLYIARLRLKGIPPEEIKPLVAQFDENTSIELRTSSIDEARIAVEEYNQSLIDAKDSFTSLSDVSSAVFDSTSSGIGKMTGAFTTMLKALEENRVAVKKLHDAKIANEKLERSTVNKTQAEIKKNNGQYLVDLETIHKFKATAGQKERLLELDTLKTSLTGIRQTSDAIGEMFAENTNARRAFSIVSLAASVAERIADIQALTIKASIAVLEQGKGDPYTAFARMAAMAAIVASIIAAAGAGTFRFGGGSTGTKPTSSTDTGTVLGDKTANSESLTNVANLLKEIHAKEYRELRGINNGIIAMNKGVTDTITRMFQAGGLPPVPLTASKTQVGGSGIGGAIHTGAVIGSLGLANFDPISKAIMGFLFGGKQTKTVVGQGIATGPSNVGNILNNDKFYASLYADIETKTKGGIFSKDKVRYERIYQQMDADTSDALTKVFRSMGQTMFSLAEQLGVGLGQRVKNYVIPALFIDLQGLNGEDAAKKVNGVISSMLDSMSTAVFGDIVGKYQKLGEGMLETAVRIIAEVAVVKDALGISGIVLEGNAIAISDALVQAAGSIKLFQDQFENYYDAFYSNAEKQTRLYGKLSETFADVGSIVPQTRKAYRDMLEALDLTNEADRTRYSLLLALSEAADTYYNTLDANKDTFRQAFHTEAENQARAYGQLSKQLTTVTLQLPNTREGFRKLVEGLDLTNTADRERYYLLLELSSAADSYYQSLEAVAAAQREATAAARAQARQDIEAAQQLKLANKVAKTDAAFAAYEKQLKNQLDATLKSIEAQKKVAQEIVSKWSELLGQLKSAKDSTIVDTLETSRLKRIMAEAVIAGAATTARAGGNVNTTGLADALTEITKPSENFYSSFEEYALAQAKTGNNIEDLNKHATKQKTDAEKTLERLDESAKAAQEYYNTSIATAREQIDAIRNVSRNILTLADAIAKEGAYRDKISKGPNQNLAILNAYENETGLTISASRMAHFQEVAKRRGLSQEELDKKIANSRDAQIADLFLEMTGKAINANRMRRYLKILKEGGTMSDVQTAIKLTEAYKNTHFNGLASVPYDGYQATLHKNEAVVDAQSVSAIQRYFRVTPNSGNNNAISEELLAELKLLRKTVEEQGKKLESIDKSSKSSADTLDKSSAGGPLLVQVV